MTNILIIDDEESILWVLKEGLTDKNNNVLVTSEPSEAERLLKNGDIDVCIVDIFLQRGNGLELVEKWSPVYKNTVFFVMTAQNTGTNIINSMKVGALDFISKPFDIEEIKEKISSSIKSSTNQNQLILQDNYDFQSKCKRMEEIYKTIGRVAKTDINILIQGETGTGKEVIAKLIHERSSRNNRSFIPINMAAIPKELIESELFGYNKGAFTGAAYEKSGKFEEANGGTIFLDEISETELSLQSKLLRVIQEKEITRLGSNKQIKLDIRVIAATNRNLEEAIRDKTFREDLFYRLNIVTINLPPLRERKEDIPVLVSYFLRKYSNLKGGQCTLNEDVLDVLIKYSWPGNIRELENVIQYSIVQSNGRIINKTNLPMKIMEENLKTNSPSLSNQLYSTASDIIVSEMISGSNNAYNEYLKIVEKPLIQAILDKTSGNKSESATILGINRNTLRKIIKDHKIE